MREICTSSSTRGQRALLAGLLYCTSPISWTKRLPRDFEEFHDLTCRRDNRIVLRTAGLERIGRHFRQSCAKFFNLSAATFTQPRHAKIGIELVEPIRQGFAGRFIGSFYGSNSDGACDI